MKAPLAENQSKSSTKREGTMKHTFARKLIQIIACLPLVSLFAPILVVDAQTVQMAQANDQKAAAAEAARAAFGGKVLKVEEITKDNKALYRVKLLLKGGRIKYVTVDASSGKLV